MNPSKATQTSNSRLKIGAAVLNAAQVVDTKSVKARLSAFTEAQQTYTDAQRKVDETEARVDAEKVRLAQIDADHDDAVEALARSLVSDGQPRGNPFASFGDHSPSAIKVMPPADAVRAARALIAAVERSKSVSQPTLDAAKHVEQEARKLEEAIGPLESLREELRAARHMREVIARSWHEALAALRRGARAAADEGAPGLYPALFETHSRSQRKAKSAPPQPTGETPAQSTPPAA